MSDIVNKLVEMGFSKERAELAARTTAGKSVESAMEWLLSNEEKSEDGTPSNVETTEGEVTEEGAADNNLTVVAKSIKCEECGRLFKNQTEVEFHSAKTGHENYAESTEEKQELTEDEKREQLAKIEAKLKQRRLEREAREKQEELEREKSRIRSGKEMLEAKKKHEETEIRKLVEQRKREKEEERKARQRVKEQIEQDKLMRKAKLGDGVLPPTQEPLVVQPIVRAPLTNCSEVQLQIRLTDGNALKQKFGAKEPLSAVKLFVELNRTDEHGPFTLMTNFPKKVFGPDDYDKPLEILGLAPSAVLIVTKSPLM